RKEGDAREGYILRLASSVLMMAYSGDAQITPASTPSMGLAVVPPIESFSMPNYPMPSPGHGDLVFPYYKGETQSNLGTNSPYSISRYQFPVGTQVQLLNQDLPITANQYYPVQIQFLPSRQHLSQVQGLNFLMLGSTLLG